MKYRLKNQELQKQLDEISDGDFSLQLEEHLQDIKCNGITDADYRVFFGELSGQAEMVNRFSMLLYEHEVEQIKEYDPNDWNNYPEVTPPEGVLMRIEAEYDICPLGSTFRTCAIFEDGAWRSESNGKAAIDSNGCYDDTFDRVKRFRPWE